MDKGEGYAGDFGTPEEEVPENGLSGIDRETCMTMNDTWGYKTFDHNWKSTKTLIRNLVDIVSKGGNYLLNVGPKADGAIPQESIHRLREMGEWMAINAESIYKTTASPFDQPAWGRYTKKENMLFAHVFDWPQTGELRLSSINRNVEQLNLLTANGEKKLKFTQSHEGVRIVIPTNAPDEIDSVIKIHLEELW